MRKAESLKICTLMGYFCRKYVMFELKQYIGIVSGKGLMVSNMNLLYQHSIRKYEDDLGHQVIYILYDL